MANAAEHAAPPGSGPVPPLRFTSPYRPRHLRFLCREPIAGWQVKLYGIALHGRTARPELVEATRSRAAEALPQPPLADDRYGAAFAIAHDANGICFALIYWWQNENELHQRVYASPAERPGRMTLLTQPGAGCVWELGIIDFERRAWIEDVLANPGGPDIAKYLERQLNADL